MASIDTIQPEVICLLRSLSAALLALILVAPAEAQTLEQMAGQMIIVGFAGDDASDKSVKAMAAEIAAGELGGVMYLKTNVKSLKAVKAMNAAFRAASPDLPPFITLDQEGGAVERLTKDVGFKEVPNAATIAADNSPAGAEAIYAAMARGVADLGFTVNFGPVADLNVNPKNTVIAKFGRAFGKSAETVTAYDEAFIEAHHAAGLLTSLKHFPGHGSSTADSHEGFVDISRTWSDAELEPYRAMFADGYADMVMVGHLYHEDYAGSGVVKLPASLSPDWIDGVLRGESRLSRVWSSATISKWAPSASSTTSTTRWCGRSMPGIDVLLFSNTAAPSPNLADKIRGILVAEAESDPAFRARIEASYARIIALKARIGG